MSRQPQSLGHGPCDPGDVGRRAARRRMDLDLTREQVAARAGMAEGYLEYVEEQPAQLTSAALTRLAHALDTSPYELLGGGVEQPPGRGAPRGTPVLEQLTVRECLALLAPGGVGRVACTTESGPFVVPVNFVLADDTIVFRTAPDTVQAAHLGNEVGFEVDHLDEATSEGWSVLVVGPARRVHEERELRHLRDRVELQPWAGGVRDLYVRIEPSRVSGRRVRAG